MVGRPLTPEEAGQVYDRIGRFQDWQRFYEGPAVKSLIAHADFEHAHSVFELGCGTGAMAAALLQRHVPADAAYVGVDVSATMVEIASGRLARFGNRATVRTVDGRPPFAEESHRFDRFLALYVFDLLDDALVSALMDEARRLLAPNGRLCLVSLTHGTSTTSRAVCGLWNLVWERAPKSVGGCRPVDLLPMRDRWRIEYSTTSVAWAVPSQVVVASPMP
jgi:SAM-dependent methyltransferase